MVRTRAWHGFSRLGLDGHTVIQLWCAEIVGEAGEACGSKVVGQILCLVQKVWETVGWILLCLIFNVVLLWVSIHSCIYILGCGLGHKLIQDLYTVKHHASIGLVSYNFHFQNGKKKKQL